ncbi:MAG TPA: D-arabinono-1,4-lactone oxidase [Solirubrobacteraceae bacterium]|nr:D-arabinono-1,4-lactone oxidase [Solirubrobacteraceae bacterium]
MWRNWSGELSCAPAVVARPRTRGEVAEALGRAAEAGRPVRVAGAGHSFSDLVITDGTLIVLDHLDRLLDVDPAGGRVRVEAGITLAELSARLALHGLALENLGDVNIQTVAGAAATGTHGTGGRLGNLSSLIEEVELVLADGSDLRCSASEDPDAWRAARVSLGALGVVVAMTLRCVPLFTLRGVDRPAPLRETLDRLDELVAASDHFELFTFPHTGVALTRTNTRIDAEPNPPGPARRFLEDVALVNGALEVISRAGRRFPGAIPALNRLTTRLAGERVRVDRSDRIFASPRYVRFTEMEYAVPREHTARAVRRVLAAVEREGFAINFPVEVRFVAADDALLSPAAGRPTGYVAVHAFRGMEWRPFFEATEAIMDELGGRPHWGKRHFQTAATVRGRYPGWDRFQAVRARLDPDGRFTTPPIERVLGPVGSQEGPPLPPVGRDGVHDPVALDQV